MEKKRIKVSKENVSKKTVELKEEDLEKVAGGGMYRYCEVCGYGVRCGDGKFMCPNCGHFN